MHTQSVQVLFYSTLDQRIKPAHVKSVFYLGSEQLDRLPVAGLSCCVRLCMYLRVHESVLLLLLCVYVRVCQVAEMWSVTTVYICVYTRARV